jgi:hypothetical protein
MGYPGMESFAYVVYPEFFVLTLLGSGVAGVLVSLILKLRIRALAIAKDAFLGATMSLIAFYTLWRLGFQHSFVAAIVIAVVLPTLHEFYRSKQVRPK